MPETRPFFMEYLRCFSKIDRLPTSNVLISGLFKRLSVKWKEVSFRVRQTKRSWEGMQKRRKYSMLVVEDDPDDQFLIKEALIPFQDTFGLLFFEDGQELLNHLNKKSTSHKPPDLIILDLNLPIRSGQEVLSEIKSHPVYRNIPLVIFTNSDSPEDKDFCRRMEVSDFVTKPSTYPDFFNVVQAMVQKWVLEVK
jgi:CheY-like chemotaxis protein